MLFSGRRAMLTMARLTMATLTVSCSFSGRGRLLYCKVYCDHIYLGHIYYGPTSCGCIYYGPTSCLLCGRAYCGMLGLPRHSFIDAAWGADEKRECRFVFIGRDLDKKVRLAT